MKVTVFGGARPKPGDPTYKMAFELGGMLAQAGHTVLSGGYIGTMEAVSRGAYEEGGTVIGVVCDEIENWREVSPNDYLTEEVRFETLKQRLAYLMDACEAGVVLPGGLGTMVELSLLWNEMAIDAHAKVPLILIGIGWQETFEAFFANLGTFVREGDRELLTFVTDVNGVIPVLEQYEQANGESPLA